MLVCCLAGSYAKMIQVMTAELRLDLPWVPQSPERIGDLVIRRGQDDVLSYDDGITLDVRLLDPVGYASAEALLSDARSQEGPGRAVLIAGAVPVDWRVRLRKSELSFIDVAGVVDIIWPRLRASASRFAQPVKRRRSPLPLQKGHARVVQELLIAAAQGAKPTITDLAEGAGVTLSTASRAISQLAEHGLVARERTGRHVAVTLMDRVEVAERLATQTAWPGEQAVSGYLWGRNVWDLGARISENAAEAGIDLAITGHAGAAFLGVLGTSSPAEMRCWVDVDGGALASAAEELGLEPAPEDASNVVLSADRWKAGVHRRSNASFEEWTATVAHPVRVWCDLHSEIRGVEFAAQLWGVVSGAR
jgi:DNA-binding transcriptional ArsR family regulator